MRGVRRGLLTPSIRYAAPDGVRKRGPMAGNSPRKSEAARRANQVVRSRTVIIMLLLGVCTFVMLFWKLYDLQIRRHDELQAQAAVQQTRESVVTASRGTIYDRNYHPLATSATAENVCISPLELAAYVQKQEKANEEAQEQAIKSGKTYVPAVVLDEAYVARGLSRILGVPEEDILQMASKTKTKYQVVSKRVEQDVADEVRRFINGEIDDEGRELTFVNEEGKTRLLSNPTKAPTALQGIFLELDSRRYYPYGTLAANVVGFVNGENQGAYGLESKFNDVLEGTSGYTVAAKNARNTDLPFHYENIIDPENGYDMMLTLDTRVQASLEKNMESMLETFDAKNGGTGIVMEVNTGAIIAMASYPTFDPGNYSAIHDEKLLASVEKELEELEKKKDTYEAEEDYSTAISNTWSKAQGLQWRNRCVSDTYEPGSTFKPITLAAALEEGVVNMNSSFSCSGSVMVQGWDKAFNCSKKSGHGTQSLKVAVGNSCNPAFISIGLKMGTQKYYSYLRSFGLMDPTGFDMAVGEGKGIFADEKNFNSNVVSLASYAFGQTFNVTPLELIRAQAACINGGYLYTPYIVDQVLDGNGNIIEQHGAATPVRQVVSEETSALVRECLEYVVAEGTGKNGQVTGYRIGGKTGTADKTGTRTDSNPKGDVVVSFMCFAPADDPQYIMLITMDTPSRNTGVFVSGGNMVAPTASRIMGEILPDLGIEPDYSSSELLVADAPVPNVVGLTMADAKAKLENAGFACRTVGDGETVTAQTPAGGAIVPNDASIILYLGQEKPDAPCTVPNVSGRTAAEANRMLTNAGLIMKVAGTTVTGSGNVHAMSQNVAEGTELPAGSVVTVWFGDSSVLD